MEIIREYLALCWFRNDPLELSRSMSLFKTSLIGYFIIGYLLEVNMIDDPFEAFYEIILQIIFMITSIGFLLFLNKTMYVFVQIVTAFLFSANIVAFFIAPVMVWLTITEDAYSYYLLFILLTWYYLIVSYIIKYTFIINVPASLVLAFLYFLITYLGAFAVAQVI